MDSIKYRGYTGTIEYSKENNCLFGKVIDIPRCLISYEGQNLKELIDDFHAAIDDYIVECENNGVEPVEPDDFKSCANCGKEMNMTNNGRKI